jgi:hypothetical protein
LAFSLREINVMTIETEDEMRTALRQAGAIVTVSGRHSVRQTLGLAHEIYNALMSLEHQDRVRRIELIDAVFGSPLRDLEDRPGDI